MSHMSLCLQNHKMGKINSEIFSLPSHVNLLPLAEAANVIICLLLTLLPQF